VITRGKWQGMMTIVRFNWPYYVAAVVVVFVSLAGLCLLGGIVGKLICAAALAGAAYFLFGSLGVSHLVYDRSDLYRWGWLQRALRGAEMRDAIFCHSGFDESSAELRERFPETRWTVLDHFDREHMTEASIRRARALFPPTADTMASPSDAWPVAAQSADVVFGLLAIHELRSEAERGAWFLEARRCLRRGGRVVLVEHLRDAANFLAFGPGFVHFHSPASWRRCLETAGFTSLEQFRLTAFVRVFVLLAP